MVSRQLILIFLTSTIVFVSAFTFVQFFSARSDIKRAGRTNNNSSSESFAFPTGWNYTTTYMLEVE
jgi:hypothetical protein